MRIDLEIPYTDARAGQLSFSLARPRLPALASRDISLHGMDIELRLLGTSHQVVAGPIAETVACLPSDPSPLPSNEQRLIEGWRYDFVASIFAYGKKQFEESVEELLGRAYSSEHSLAGVFPGSPYATTILTALSDGDLGWQTWHCYPQTGEIVTTRTTLIPSSTVAQRSTSTPSSTLIPGSVIPSSVTPRSGRPR